MRGISLVRTATCTAAAGLVLVVLASRATAHCLGGIGIYQACGQHANANGDASSRIDAAISARQVAHSSQQYRYSNRHGRLKPAIKRMGQINVRNRNGGIR